MNNIYFTIAVVFFLAALGVILLRHLRRVRQAANSDWEELLSRLEPVNRENIARIAHDALQDDSSAEYMELDGPEMSSLLGGLEGLEVLERNCHVLVDLAAYVQRWYPEALVVAEQLRMNARELEWHVARLKGAAQTGSAIGICRLRSASGGDLLRYDAERSGAICQDHHSWRYGSSGSSLDRQLTRRAKTAATVPTTSISFLKRQRLLASYESG